MKRLVRLILMSAVLTTGACDANSSRGLQPEAVSLLGEPLTAPQLPLDDLLERSRQLNDAHRFYLMDTNNESSTIWFGRRLAYLGRYVEAIDVYTDGLEIHPESYKLRRHRGHRYITIRRLDDAIIDLAQAAELIENVPDMIEPDGMPNAQGIPTSTTNSNIYYHLGLAHYLKGEWELSRAAYVKYLEFAKNDDSVVAGSYWLVLILHRLGLEMVADEVIERIDADLEIIENFAYHKLLLYFKGDLSLDQITEGEADALQNTTTAYGIAVWAMIKGDPDDAVRRYREIVATTDQWAAFGFITAEAELARSQP